MPSKEPTAGQAGATGASRGLYSAQRPASGMGLADLWAVYRRWWWQCTAGGIALAFLGGGAVLALFVPSYEASAWLEIKDQAPVVAFQSANQSSVFAETQIQTIRSPICLLKVVADPVIASLPEIKHSDAPLDWLKQGLKVTYVGRSELCEISFKAENPQAAASVANAVMDAYLSLHTAMRGKEAERIIELLKEEKAHRGEEVRHFQEKVRLITKHATEDDPSLMHHDQQVILQANPLSGLEERRTAAEVEIAVLEARLKVSEELAASDEVEIAPTDLATAVESHPEMQKLKAQHRMQTALLRDHRRRSKLDDDSMAARMQQQVEELEETIKQTAAELRPQLIEQLRSSRRGKQQEQIAELKANIENQRLMQQLWQARVEKQREKIEKLGDKTVDLEFARDELARAQEVFEKIADRIVMLQTEMGAPLRASPMQRATAPTKPRELIPWKRLGPAAVAGLFLPFAVAVFWEQRQRRIHDVRHMAQEVNLPVLGEITALPARMAFSGPRSEERFVRDQLTFQESIEALRVGLTVSPETRDLQTLAVTSAISREGKSSLASSLAASLAKATRKPTLIIDGDMRCPSLHEIFDRDISPGLTDVLAGRCSAADSVVATDSPWLHFLPSGQLKFTPHALLQDGTMEAALAELRPRYRYIVIDLPPVLAASEALVLAGAAQGTLVCAMRDVSRGPQFRLACERLASSGARILGTVINGLPARAWAYKYGGYGYGWERYAQAGAGDEAAGGRPALPPPGGNVIDA